MQFEARADIPVDRRRLQVLKFVFPILKWKGPRRMRRFAIGVLCLLGVLVCPAQGQTSSLQPIHVPAGTVLTFHLQTLLHPAGEDALNVLPKGTLLQVKILDSIDSSVNRDGSEFHGSIAFPVVSRDVVVVHSQAEVRGLFALLRNRSHPQGFRYELLITGLTDRGKSYALTASLSPSFFDGANPPAISKPGTRDNSTLPN
jgi:hypothetical protein